MYYLRVVTQKPMNSMMFFLLLLTLVTFAQATFECPKRQNYTVQEANNCCNVQRPKWDVLPIKCSRYMIALNKPVSPCAFECVMNVTHVLKNGRFDVANIRQLLQKVYTDEASLDAHVAAFKKCATNFNKMLSEQSETTKNSTRTSSSRKPPSSQQCSPNPLKLAMCASREVFNNCPAIHWTASSTCEYIREYSKNCQATLSLKIKNNRSHSSG